MESLNITREQIQEMGEEQLNRLKAYKVILESMIRSEAAHKSAQNRKQASQANELVDFISV